ncbi:hypothetical protein ATO6_18755 [Oceanicola sp. 22II-s10i]|uniref:hypothetical protein n=1 Tax=Oceanicola sp. 22II-s10i TaxID=1317116 RepID=UPI000B527939|nr:hypothetical protein [Oceanicola sp. 22II-s10i]OWU83478.1 hypothetical protein ATO6_18755 [Oceanicola sp. 22II-s10i]
MRGFGLLLALCTGLSGGAQALDLRGPALAVASSFGQSMPPDLLDRALSLGVRDFRDELFWFRTEGDDGRFRFDTPLSNYPDRIGAAGGTVSLLVNNGHQNYEDGATPLGTRAVRGFGRHAAAVVQRFPEVTSVEVGNEFNSDGFVSGPLRDRDLDARAAAYTALLQSVHEQVRAVRPEVRIIGGGVHSVPTGYLRRMLELGAADYMDSIALHPYDTPVDQLRREIDVMRRLPGLAEMPVEITEFGSESTAEAANTFLRGYCQMALSGVSRLAWYALNERGDGFVPLIGADLQTTPAFDSWTLVRDRMEGRAVIDASPDPVTYGCLFDERVLVIWGEPRELTVLAPDVRAVDATGAPLDGDQFTLQTDAPVILLSDRPIKAGRDYRLGPQGVIADSFHQFTFPDPDRPGTSSDPFRRFLRYGTKEFDLQTMPGQDKPGRPWTPWLGLPEDESARLLANVILPVSSSGQPVEIVHAFTAPEPMRLDVKANFEVLGDGGDGITVTVRRNGTAIGRWTGRDRYAFERADLALNTGDTLEIAVSAGGSADGDLTAYRITLRRPG